MRWFSEGCSGNSDPRGATSVRTPTAATASVPGGRDLDVHASHALAALLGLLRGQALEAVGRFCGHLRQAREAAYLAVDHPGGGEPARLVHSASAASAMFMRTS